MSKLAIQSTSAWFWALKKLRSCAPPPQVSPKSNSLESGHTEFLRNSADERDTGDTMGVKMS